MQKVLPRITKLRESALDLFFPQHCIGCGESGSFICASCSYSFPHIAAPVCPLCGRPHSGSTVCPSCLTWKTDLSGIRSPFRFEGVIRQAVHQLKYRNLRAIVPLLAELMADYLKRCPIPGDILVPVPLHKNRLRERGYNQSYLLAIALGDLCDLSVDARTLIKVRNSRSQAKAADVEARKHNVLDSYACRSHGLDGASVILIDDVSTSGATLDACATALKQSGVTQVWGLTLAREI